MVPLPHGIAKKNPGGDFEIGQMTVNSVCIEAKTQFTVPSVGAGHYGWRDTLTKEVKMADVVQSSPQTPKPHAAPSAQDQAEANKISSIAETIKVAMGDPEITALMLPKAYDPARYAAG